jgi:hypothetical protein
MVVETFRASYSGSGPSDTTQAEKAVAAIKKAAAEIATAFLVVRHRPP